MTDLEKFKIFLNELGIEYEETKTSYPGKGNFCSNDSNTDFIQLIKEIDESNECLPIISLDKSVLGYGMCNIIFTPKTFKFFGIEAE